MKSKNNKDIKDEFDALFKFTSQEEEIEHETLILASKFLGVIEEIIENKGITKRELAEMIGTSPSYITQLFRGHKTININTIAKIQKELEIKFDIGLTDECNFEKEINEEEISDLLDVFFKTRDGDYLKVVKNQNTREFYPDYAETNYMDINLTA